MKANYFYSKNYLILVFFLIFLQDVWATAKTRQKPFFNFLEFYSGTEITFPYDEIQEANQNFITESESKKNGSKSGYECDSFYDSVGYIKAKNSSGIHFSLRGLDFKTYATFPKTDFSFFQKNYEESGLWGTVSESFKNFEDPSFGISFNSEDFFTTEILRIPLTIRYGSLSYSKSVSKIKNPKISGGTSALSGSSFSCGGIGANLPSTSGAKKDSSVALKFSPKILNLECAVFEDSTIYYSVGKSFKFGKFSNFSTAITGTRFYLEEKSSSSWFLDEKYFQSQWCDFVLWENVISIPGAKSKISVGLNSDPFENFRFWLKNENRTVLGPILLNSGFFIADRFFTEKERQGFFTLSSNLQDTVLQIKLNPQYLWNFSSEKNRNLLLGIVATAEKTKENLNPSEEKTEISGGIAAKLYGKINTAQLSATLSNYPYDKNEFAEFDNRKTTFQAQFSHKFDTWKLSVKGTFSSTESDSENFLSQNFSTSAYFYNKILYSISAGYSKSENSSGESQKVNCSFNFKESKGKIRFRGKIKLDLEL